jgi:DNA-binding NtrC family response regulator
VRELENVLTKAVALSPTDTITLDLIPEFISEKHEQSSDLGMPVQTSLEEMEKIHVARVLNFTNWHKGETCKILGISRPRLRRIIKQHQMVDPCGTENEEVDIEDFMETEPLENSG